METQTEKIIEYMKNAISFIEGQGLIVTDWDLVEEALLNFGDFLALKEICNEENKNA